MRIKEHGSIFKSEQGTDRQSCAFPQVAVLPDGRWLCGCRAGCTKTGKDGQHVMLAYSDDEGKTWEIRHEPFVAPVLEGKPGQFRTAALTPLGGGRVLATLCWVDNTDPALPFFNEQTEGLLDSRIMFAESNDRGETWSEPVLMNSTPFNMPTPITGPVLLLPDGERICQFETNKTYFDTTKWIHQSVLMFSHDNGNTWPRHSIVTRDPRVFYWDQRPQVLPDGRILDLFWTYDNGVAEYLNIHARESSDGGRNWSLLRDTGVAGQPAPVVALSDNKLALVYVDRAGTPAIRCRVSCDDGQTWLEPPLTLYASDLAKQTVCKDGMSDAWAEMGKFSVGLPATASLKHRNEFLVVYYAGAHTDSTDILWARVEV